MPGLLRDLAALYEHIQDPGKAQRQQIQLMLAQDPQRFQGLVDSNLANDPNQLMQALGIQNARFGHNSNAGTELAQSISSAPLSDQEKAIRTRDLQNVNPQDVVDATKEVPQLRAFNGMGTAPFAQMTPQVVQALGNPSQSMLTPQQQDVINVKNGLPTAQQQENLKAVGALDNAEAASAITNAQRTKAEIPGVIAQSGIAARTNTAQQSADNTIAGYFANNPGAQKRKLWDIYTDPNTTEDVKSALPLSSQYGDSFKTEFEDHLQSEQRKLEMLLRTNDNQFVMQRLRENAAYMAYAQSGYNGDIQGFLDLYGGNKQTPAAQQAAAILSKGTPAQKQARVNTYNKMLASITKDIQSKKVEPQQIQTEVDYLNSIGAGLNASGIAVDDLIFGPVQNPNIGQKIQNLSPNPRFRAYGLQTVSGGTPSAVKYNSKADAGNNTGPVSSTGNTDMYSAQSIVDLIRSGKADLSTTLSDPRVSPEMRKQIMQLMGLPSGSKK